MTVLAMKPAKELRKEIQDLEARMKRATPGSAGLAAFQDRHVILWGEKQRRLHAHGSLEPIRVTRGRGRH